jgi:hypothetical protein
MYGCEQPLLQAKLGSSDLARIESIKAELYHVSKIVSNPPTSPAKSTEASWSVMFKLCATILVSNAIWRVYCKIMFDKLKDFVEDKADDLRSYVYKKITGKSYYRQFTVCADGKTEEITDKPLE